MDILLQDEGCLEVMCFPGRVFRSLNHNLVIHLGGLIRFLFALRGACKEPLEPLLPSRFPPRLADGRLPCGGDRGNPGGVPSIAHCFGGGGRSQKRRGPHPLGKGLLPPPHFSPPSTLSTVTLLWSVQGLPERDRQSKGANPSFCHIFP